MIEIRPSHKRFWWPHPYAQEAGMLWVKLVVGYRYFVDGIEWFGPCGIDGPRR